MPAIDAEVGEHLPGKETFSYTTTQKLQVPQSWTTLNGDYLNV